MNGHQPDDNDPVKDPMTEKMREAFDHASEHLDAATGNRLRLMRRDALANTRRALPYRWFPLGAAAATVLGVGLTWWLPQQRMADLPAQNGVAATDADLLPDDDTEIYAWLGEAPVATDDGKGNSQ